MAYTPYEITSAETSGSSDDNSSNIVTLNAAQSEQLALPDVSYVTEADMLKDGLDLVLQTPDGTVVIEGYFAQEPPPFLVAPGGKTLTPDLVESFAHSPQEYANADLSASDVSPVGAVQEISGEAHVIRGDGTVEVIGVGTHIYQGDVVETEEDGAVNIMFIDETTFAISEDARLAIDEYVFDPATQSGTTNFSVLKGVFVFTSGLIGREDPDDVMIDTPSGSIGIRGTIIAGNADTGEITVIEGAIVLHDFSGNTVTLSNQYETARFDTEGQNIEYIGEIGAEDVAEKFTSVSNVSGDLFSSLEDSAAESQESESQNAEESKEPTEETEAEAKPEPEAEKQPAETEAPKEAAEEDTEKSSGSEDQTEGASDGETKGIPIEEQPEQKAEEQPAETEAQEPKPMPIDGENTIITSDEIIGANVEKLGTTETVGDSTQEPPPAEEGTTNETRSTEGEKAPPQTTEEGSESPTFNLKVSKFLVNEDDDGVAIARVTGQFTENTDLKLLGPLTSNYYELNPVQGDPNTYIIRLKSGVTAGEAGDQPLNIQATNDLETVTVQRHIDLNIAYENQAIELAPNGADPDYFSGTNGSHIIYNMAQEFHDPEGSSITYSVNPGTLGTSGYLQGPITIDPDTGKLTIDLVDSGISVGGNYSFTVIASDGVNAPTTKSFDFDVVGSTVEPDAAGMLFLFAAGEYSTTDDAVGIAGSPGTIVYDLNTAGTIDGNGGTEFSIGANLATVRAGQGNDTFDIGAEGYNLYGEQGNDKFDYRNDDGRVFAGDGNDEVIIYDTAGVDLNNTDLGDTFIDGGSGRDILIFDGTGDIDFGAPGVSVSIDNNIIKNFEEFNIENGTGQNIDLTYEEVVSMTDGDNVLAINTDYGDQINFDTDGHNFIQTGVVDRNGEDYQTYTDGNVTLLIDTDINPGNINLFG